MGFWQNRFPWTNNHDLNLDWFNEHFKEIFEQWNELYTTLTQWKIDTDADLDQWKTDTLNYLTDWEFNLLDALDEWKANTNVDISDWEDLVIMDLNEWKSNFEDAYEDLADRVAAIVSDTEDMIENLANPFSTSNNYSINDYVIYEGVLYKFIANHTAGAWNSAEVVQAKAMDDYKYLDNQIANIKDILYDMIGEFPIEWESGGIYYSTGIPYSSNAAIRTKFIKVTPGSKIILNNKLNTYSVVQQYADNTTPSTGVNNKIATAEAQANSYPKTITLNASCNYIMITISQSDIYVGYNNIRLYSETNIINAYSKNYTDTAINNLKAVTTISNGTSYSNLISNIDTPGLYYLTVGAGFTDRPDSVGSVGINLKVEKYATSGYVMQTITSADGCVVHRIINTSTHNPSTADLKFYDSKGWFVYPNTAYPIRWAKKKIVVFGDSRTYMDGRTYPNTAKTGIAGTTCIGYQEQFKLLNGMQVTSQGVSGDTSIDICTRIRAYNFSNFDCVLLDGGVNDFIKYAQITIGQIDDIGATFDTNTVYGAWQSAIEYLMTNYPGLKIYLTVPAIAWSGSDVFPYEIAKIKKDIAELYNLPIIDLYTQGGITTINRDHFYSDDVSQTGWRLHFNNDGYKWIGEMIARFIENS